MKTERISTFTSHDLHEKERRNVLMLDLIRKKGVISRAEIAKATGINAVSVSNYINNFIEQKLVLEKGLDVSTGGRKPELVELNLASNIVIGVDIGKNEIRAASADMGLNIKIRKQVARPHNREVGTAVLALVDSIIGEVRSDKSDVKAIGIGTNCDRLNGIAETIRKKTGIDTFVGPAAVCAAFAEKRLNRSADNDNLLYIYSDVGEGVVVNGETYFAACEDKDRMNGKLRYLRPWDDYLSVSESMRREVARGVGTTVVSLTQGDVNNITREIVLDAAGTGDEIALNIAESAGINLGLRIAYLINLFQPQVIVIGGGVQNAGDIIFKPIKKMVERLAISDYQKNLKIIASTLGEDAVDIGAASLAIREIFLNI